MRLKVFVKKLLAYLLGFIALIVFASLAFGSGPPSPATWEKAFLVSGVVAIVELIVLWKLPKPANRLVIAANAYLIVGASAFVGKQWWLLNYYEKLGLSGILIAMLMVGIVTGLFSKTGFVGMLTQPELVRKTSVIMVLLVMLGLMTAQAFPAIDKGVGVAIITVLAFAYRALRNWIVRREARNGL